VNIRLTPRRTYDFFDDIDLLLQLAETGSTPILELGCGTGRVLQALAASEIEVTGLDRSASMLDAAVHRLSTTEHGELATLVEGDMRAPAVSVAAQFGMTAYTLNALMHLPTIEDQLASLSSARETLAPGGIVFIDIMNPHPEQLTHLGSGVILEGSWTIEDGQIVDKWSHRTIHPARQIIETDIWYDTISPAGELRRLKTSFDHRYVHASELVLMLERSGYEDILLYGSYALDPFDDDSDRLIALAKRSLA
jgi:SAM-dependent methyltransferase